MQKWEELVYLGEMNLFLKPYFLNSSPFHDLRPFFPRRINEGKSEALIMKFVLMSLFFLVFLSLFDPNGKGYLKFAFVMRRLMNYAKNPGCKPQFKYCKRLSSINDVEVL